MYMPEAKPSRQQGWVLGLAIVSLALPLAAFFLRNEPVVPLTDPARVRYYQQTVAALGFGLLCAVAAFVGMRTPMLDRMRWLSVVIASLGVLTGVGLLLLLIGTCGTGILRGDCAP